MWSSSNVTQHFNIFTTDRVGGYCFDQIIRSQIGFDWKTKMIKILFYFYMSYSKNRQRVSDWIEEYVMV